jgi:hypothetical protein
MASIVKYKEVHAQCKNTKPRKQTQTKKRERSVQGLGREHRREQNFGDGKDCEGEGFSVRMMKMSYKQTEVVVVQH